MCGIIGTVGPVDAVERVLEDLRVLEPCGYDSTGIGLTLKPTEARTEGVFRTFKEVGSTQVLRHQLHNQILPSTRNVMGHTRWATHGKKTQANAHPHVSSFGHVMVVHNGTIDNFEALRTDLIERGFTFHSDTDTEVIANLIERFYLQPPAHDDLEVTPPMQALTMALNMLEGTWALVVSFADLPDERLYVAIHREKLVIGFGEGAMYVASEPAPLYKRTKRFLHLHNGECARISPEGLFECTTVSKRSWHREPSIMEPRVRETQARPSGQFSMHYEIWESEQLALRFLSSFGSQIVREPLRTLIQPRMNADGESSPRIFLTGCGSAYHACLYGQHVLAYQGKIESQPILASDSTLHLYDHRPDDLLIAVSQSGTTFDTMRVVHAARQRGIPVLAIVNHAHVALTQEASASIYIDAGNEDGVAATKTFGLQCLAFEALAAVMSSPGFVGVSGIFQQKALYNLNEYLHEALLLEDRIRLEVAPLIAKASRVFVLGQQMLYPIAKEGALKLQEVAQSNAFALATGELKHGPLALFDQSAVTVALISDDDTLRKAAILNLREIRTCAHGLIVVIASRSSAPFFKGVADIILEVSDTRTWLQPILQVVPLQLMAYHAAIILNLNPDRPANLAKAVVVG